MSVFLPSAEPREYAELLRPCEGRSLDDATAFVRRAPVSKAVPGGAGESRAGGAGQSRAGGAGQRRPARHTRLIAHPRLARAWGGLGRLLALV